MCDGWRQQGRWEHTSKGDEVNDIGNSATGDNDEDDRVTTGKNLNDDNRWSANNVPDQSRSLCGKQ